MRQPEQLLAPDESSSYAACLSEDLQLFGQLNELQLMGSDFELTPAAIPADEATTPTPKTGKRAAPTKRQRINSCEVCGRCFSDPYTLRIHKMTHTDEKPHVCSECGKGFRQQHKLRMHSVIHTDERPHQCDICGKGFRFANYLAVHRRLHTGEKPYGCTEAMCQMSFHSIHARRMHIKLHHHHQVEASRIAEESSSGNSSTASLSYTCPVCARVLSDQCYLNTHLKRHYNQRDFVCTQPQCGKRFFSSSELNHHQIAHTRLRPFRCALCSSCFLRNSNYKQHLKLHHKATAAASVTQTC
ncbi:gastrula zinc finger protein xLCGF3.1-like [Drosophila nasuta]|uniref:gastrula zinc finger protein xLCGF3.1-like n=1 Tax=Drosophila nasuta TaxID=42062 RepID=UPI00295E64F7|nr:gastrula zinc finger protein xLCGF3.1-like [Drosophila nasuta]